MQSSATARQPHVARWHQRSGDFLREDYLSSKVESRIGHPGNDLAGRAGDHDSGRAVIADVWTRKRGNIPVPGLFRMRATRQRGNRQAGLYRQLVQVPRKVRSDVV